MAISRLSAQPRLSQHGREVQRFGTLRLLPVALSAEARAESAQLLISDVLRHHEPQVWFLSAHLVDIPLVDA